jgi:hypothetical protein
MKMILIGLAIRVMIEIIYLIIKRRSVAAKDNEVGAVMHPAEFGLRGG